MPINILMPALSPTMTEGKLSKWLVREGEKVAGGDIIAEIETDKAVMEIESIDEGEVGKILVAEGTQTPVNSTIAILLGEGETIADIISAGPETMGAMGDDSLARDDSLGKEQKQGEEEAKTSAKTTAKTTNAASLRHVQTAPAPVLGQDSALLAPEITHSSGQEMTVREALRDAMAEEMRLDGDVFVLGEEVAEYQGAYKVTQGLLAEFGAKRVIDTPITEHGFAGLAVGAAFTGLRPVVEFMTFNFAMQAIDHLINSAAKTLYMSGGQISCPIVFRGPNGAASRVGAQHSQDYASWYSHIPGLKVIAPYSAADAKGLLKSAIRDPNPVIFLENELLYGDKGFVPDDPGAIVPIGKAKIVKSGKDVTILSFAIGMRYVKQANQQLEEEGIDAEIIDLRTLRPIDYPTIVESVKKTNRCLTVEEGWPQNCIGNHLAAILMQQAFDFLDAPVLNITGKDTPMPYAANLEKLALPSVADILAAIRQICYQ